MKITETNKVLAYILKMPKSARMEEIKWFRDHVGMSISDEEIQSILEA